MSFSLGQSSLEAFPSVHDDDACGKRWNPLPVKAKLHTLANAARHKIMNAGSGQLGSCLTDMTPGAGSGVPFV
jgi:hypothetical protein